MAKSLFIFLFLFGLTTQGRSIKKYHMTMSLSSTERRGAEWVGVEWNYSGIEGFDNKVGTTLASARVLCLDLLSCVWLHISGGLNCCQELRRGVV